MKQSRKEFIRKLHAHSSIGWQSSIEKEFPKVFKENDLVAGKWYNSKENESALLCYDPKGNHFGFNNIGIWTTIYGLIKSEMITATDKEVKKALIKEAEKRGFKVGILTKYGVINSTYEHEFRPKENVFYFGNIKVFRKGKWAEIIKETITKEQAEEARKVLDKYRIQLN